MKLPQIKYQSPINTFVHLILKHQYKISFLFLFLSFSSIFLSLQILSWYQSHLLNITQETAKNESKNKDKMTIGETSNTIASARALGYTCLSISLKLTREIFLLWQTLLLPLLETHYLTHVLKEQAPPSPAKKEGMYQIRTTKFGENMIKLFLSS